MTTKKELLEKIEAMREALVRAGEEINLPEISFLMAENEALKAQLASTQERMIQLEDRLTELGEDISFISVEKQELNETLDMLNQPAA